MVFLLVSLKLLPPKKGSSPESERNVLQPVTVFDFHCQKTRVLQPVTVIDFHFNVQTAGTAIFLGQPELCLTSM